MSKKPVEKPTLLGRDPRNRLHRRRAFEILMSTANVRASRKTEAEMALIGMTLPKNTKVANSAQNYPLIAEFFLLEEGLLISDNIIAKCSGCSQYLQFRPHAQVAKTRWCWFCAVDHVLAAEEEKASKAKIKKKKAAP